MSIPPEIAMKELPDEKTLDELIELAKDFEQKALIFVRAGNRNRREVANSVGVKAQSCNTASW